MLSLSLVRKVIHEKNIPLRLRIILANVCVCIILKKTKCKLPRKSPGGRKTRNMRYEKKEKGIYLPVYICIYIYKPFVKRSSEIHE